jgi:hypothetical protein
MSIIDDLKAKIQNLDRDGNGKVNYDDLKTEAEKLGFGDKLEEMKADITGPDGKLTLDDAQRALSDVGDKLGNVKDKMFGDKK